MRKVLLIVGSCLIAVGALVFAIYEATKPSEPEVKPFNEYVIEDYHSVVDTAQEGTSVFFYEVETILNTEIDSASVDSIQIVYYKMIIQTEKNVHFINRDLTNGERNIETIEDDTWGGCFALESPEFNVSFEQALALVKDSSYNTPHTKYMTLRRPLGTRYDNAIYIFGNSLNGGLCVDSETGEVKIFE